MAESAGGSDRPDSISPEGPSSSNSGGNNADEGGATTTQTAAAPAYHFDLTTVFVSKNAGLQTPVPDFEVRGMYTASLVKPRTKRKAYVCYPLGETNSELYILFKRKAAFTHKYHPNEISSGYHLVALKRIQRRVYPCCHRRTSHVVAERTQAQGRRKGRGHHLPQPTLRVL